MSDERYERIRELVDRGYKLSTRNATRLIDEIDKLREEKWEIISSKEVIVNTPPLPESVVIDVLQKQIIDLQVQLGTLERQIRNNHRR